MLKGVDLPFLGERGSGETDMGGCNTLYWIYFGKDVLRKYKSLIGYLRNNVKLKIHVPVQGLDVLIFNRNYYKSHVFLKFGSICKEYEIKSV